MTATVQERRAIASTAPGTGNGGRPARRAMVRWAWRWFRREWRRQLLVLALLIVAVAATTAGVTVATNTVQDPATTFTLPGADPQLSADVAVLQQAFGTVEVISHQKIAVPGSIATVDLRAQATDGAHPSVRLLAGRYPSGPDEVAVTHDVAAIFNLRVGDAWHEGGRTRQVVGRVENPRDLLDQFALVAPGQADPPATVTVLTAKQLSGSVRPPRLPSGAGLAVEGRGAAPKGAVAAAILALSTIGLLFVGLVAVAGFAVMAQRRLRALGMLGSLGATDRHVRLVMVANGAIVGAVAALVGAATGVAGWITFAPRLETIAEHRIDRFALPWWAIGTAMVLAVVTATAAAWWPARSVARISIVAALAGRPPRPQPTHRFAALGGLLLAVGLGCLALAHQRRPPLIVIGTVATTMGLLLLAPLAIRAIAVAGRRAPIAVRLALRDLARYQARSGAALGAVTLAVGIAATIAVSASAQAHTDAATPGNLPANQLVVYLGGDGPGVPLQEQTAAQRQLVQSRVDGIANALHTSDVVALDRAVNPTAPDVTGLGRGQGGKEPAALVKVTARGQGVDVNYVAPLYVATPSLLAKYGIAPDQVDPTADIVTARTDVAGLQLGYGPRAEVEAPKVQVIDLPRFTSAPNALITEHAIQTLGLQALPAGWLVQTSGPLTTAQLDTARRLAADAGLTIESRNARQSLKQLGDETTAAGMLLALGVLAMTVGLIRSETANDLRTLAATGASSATRRTLTGVTAGALALLGGLLGTAGAYLALIAWHRSDLHTLSHPPFVNLVIIVVGLPVVATTAGWLLAGREPSAVARRPLE